MRVGLIGARPRSQIVDEHPNVPLIRRRMRGSRPRKLQGGVHPSHEALVGGLLVTGGAVELPGP